MTLQQAVNGREGGEHHTRNHRNQRIWTDDAVAELLRLDARGFSAAEICDRMGGGLTRSSVIGKLDRLTGGPARRIASPPPKTRPLRRIQSTLPLVKPKPKPEKFQSRASKVAPTAQNWLASGPWAALPGTSPIGLLELAHGACRWPIGDRPILFCGLASEGVYCEAHAAIAYTRASQ